MNKNCSHCFLPLSKYVRLGKGESMNSIMSDRSEVAEGEFCHCICCFHNAVEIVYYLVHSQVQGIFTTPAAAKWAEKLKLDLPIIQTVAKVPQTLPNSFHTVGRISIVCLSCRSY